MATSASKLFRRQNSGRPGRREWTQCQRACDAHSSGRGVFPASALLHNPRGRHKRAAATALRALRALRVPLIGAAAAFALFLGALVAREVVFFLGGPAVADFTSGGCSCPLRVERVLCVWAQAANIGWVSASWRVPKVPKAPRE